MIVPVLIIVALLCAVGFVNSIRAERQRLLDIYREELSHLVKQRKDMRRRRRNKTRKP